MTLALTYRPRTFTEIVGQKPVKAVLARMVANGTLPACLLFAGSRGTGKTTTARILAAALNCSDKSSPNPCRECSSCKAVEKGSSLDALEIDAASNGLVADIRKIKELCAYAQTGEWRVVLLDEAHSMSREAFNALLKLLEEPPPRTVFVLLTTEPHKILETVVSRSMLFTFKRISVLEIEERLLNIKGFQSFDTTSELCHAIAEKVEGGMRDAIMLLEQCDMMNITTVEAFNNAFGYDDISVELLHALLAQDHAAAYELVRQHHEATGDPGTLVSDLTRTVAGCLRQKSGADLPHLRELAGRVGTPQLVAAVRVLWDLKNHVKLSDGDILTTMQLACVMIADALNVDKSASNGHAPKPLGKMTLDAMRSRVGSQ